jgi:signal transduction histidine kinase
MSNTVPDAVARSLAAVCREQDAIAQRWRTQLAGGGGDDGADPEIGETANRLVAAVCARLAATNGRPADATPGPAEGQAAGQAGSSGPGDAVHSEAAALTGLHTVLLESAAAELESVAGATIEDAFGVSAAIGEALAGVRAQQTVTTPAVAASAAPDADGGDRFDSFARTIAHELKNPLGAARGAAEMLATGEGLESDEDRTRFAQLVLRNINRALDLLDDARATAQSAASGT